MKLSTSEVVSVIKDICTRGRLMEGKPPVNNKKTKTDNDRKMAGEYNPDPELNTICQQR